MAVHLSCRPSSPPPPPSPVQTLRRSARLLPSSPAAPHTPDRTSEQPSTRKRLRTDSRPLHPDPDQLLTPDRTPRSIRADKRQKLAPQTSTPQTLTQPSRKRKSSVPGLGDSGKAAALHSKRRKENAGATPTVDLPSPRRTKSLRQVPLSPPLTPTNIRGSNKPKVASSSLKRRLRSSTSSNSEVSVSAAGTVAHDNRDQTSSARLSAPPEPSAVSTQSPTIKFPEAHTHVPSPLSGSLAQTSPEPRGGPPIDAVDLGQPCSSTSDSISQKQRVASSSRRHLRSLTSESHTISPPAIIPAVDLHTPHSSSPHHYSPPNEVHGGRPVARPPSPGSHASGLESSSPVTRVPTVESHTPSGSPPRTPSSVGGRPPESRVSGLESSSPVTQISTFESHTLSKSSPHHHPPTSDVVPGPPLISSFAGSSTDESPTAHLPGASYTDVMAPGGELHAAKTAVSPRRRLRTASKDSRTSPVQDQQRSSSTPPLPSIQIPTAHMQTTIKLPELHTRIHSPLSGLSGSSTAHYSPPTSPTEPRGAPPIDVVDLGPLLPSTVSSFASGGGMDYNGVAVEEHHLAPSPISPSSPSFLDPSDTPESLRAQADERERNRTLVNFTGPTSPDPSGYPCLEPECAILPSPQCHHQAYSYPPVRQHQQPLTAQHQLPPQLLPSPHPLAALPAQHQFLMYHNHSLTHAQHVLLAQRVQILQMREGMRAREEEARAREEGMRRERLAAQMQQQQQQQERERLVQESEKRAMEALEREMEVEMGKGKDELDDDAGAEEIEGLQELMGIPGQMQAQHQQPSWSYEEPPVQKWWSLWKIACTLRVYEIRRRYSSETLRSIVAQEAADYYSKKGYTPPPALHRREFMDEEYYDWELRSDDDGEYEQYSSGFGEDSEESDEDEEDYEDSEDGDDDASVVDESRMSSEEKSVRMGMRQRRELRRKWRKDGTDATATAAGDGSGGADLDGDADGEGEMEIDLAPYDDPTFNAELSSPPVSPTAFFGAGAAVSATGSSSSSSSGSPATTTHADQMMSAFYVPPAPAPVSIPGMDSSFTSSPDTVPASPPLPQDESQTVHRNAALHVQTTTPSLEPQQSQQQQQQQEQQMPQYPAQQQLFLPPSPILPLPPPRLSTIRVPSIQIADTGAPIAGRGTPVDRERRAAWAAAWREPRSPSVDAGVSFPPTCRSTGRGLRGGARAGGGFGANSGGHETGKSSPVDVLLGTFQPNERDWEDFLGRLQRGGGVVANEEERPALSGAERAGGEGMAIDVDGGVGVVASPMPIPAAPLDESIIGGGGAGGELGVFGMSMDGWFGGDSGTAENGMGAVGGNAAVVGESTLTFALG